MTTGSKVIQRAVDYGKRDWIMGIDPSVTETGYCYGKLGKVSDEPGDFWGAGVIRHHKDLRGMARVRATMDGIEKVLTEVDPVAVFMEGYAFSRGKVGRIFDLAEMGMAIKLVVLRFGIPIIVVPPTTLKAFVTGRGNAQKQEVAAAIQSIWGPKFSNDNKADAYGLMIYGQYQLEMLSRTALEPAQVKALQKAELIEAGPFAEG